MLQASNPKAAMIEHSSNWQCHDAEVLLVKGKDTLCCLSEFHYRSQDLFSTIPDGFPPVLTPGLNSPLCFLNICYFFFSSYYLIISVLKSHKLTPSNARGEPWAGGWWSPCGHLRTDAQLDAANDNVNNACSCQAWLCLHHCKPECYKWQTAKTTKGSPPRMRFESYLCNEYPLERRRRGSPPRAARCPWQWCPLEASRPWAPQHPEKGSLQDRALPLEFLWLWPLFTLLPDQITGLLGSASRRSGCQQYMAEHWPRITTRVSEASKLVALSKNHCQGRCCARLISLHLGIRILDANSYIAEWHAHGLHLDVVLCPLHRKVLLFLNPHHLWSLIEHAPWVPKIYLFHHPYINCSTGAWPNHEDPNHMLAGPPQVACSGSKAFAPTAWRASRRMLCHMISVNLCLPTKVGQHSLNCGCIAVCHHCVCVRAHAGECKRTLSGKWGISETLFCVCFSTFSFFQLSHRWHQALYQIHITAYQLKQTNTPKSSSKIQRRIVKDVRDELFPFCLVSNHRTLENF